MKPRKVMITFETTTSATIAELRALRGKLLWPSPAVYKQFAIRIEQIKVNVIRSRGSASYLADVKKEKK